MPENMNNPFDSHNEDDGCFMDNRADINGLDLTGPEYDDIFADHQRIHELADRFDKAQARLRQHFDASGHASEVTDRLNAVKRDGAMRLKSLLSLRKLAEVVGDRNSVEQVEAALRKADPLVLTDLLMQVAEVYAKVQDDALFGSGPLSLFLPEGTAKGVALELFKRHYIEALRLGQKLTIMLAEQTLATLPRMARGAPDWDWEQGQEIAGTVPFTLPEVDLFSDQPIGSAAEAAAQQPQTAEDEQALVNRLLNSIGF